MHLDPVTGLWKSDNNDYIPKKATEDLPDAQQTEVKKESLPALNGYCTLSIRLNNHGEHLKWIQYNGTPKWEFVVTYPAIVRAKYEFHDSADVDVLSRKIVRLLEWGFDVYSANWKLTKMR